MELLVENNIILDSSVTNQKDAFLQLSKLSYSLGYAKDQNELLKAFEARESQSTTGFSDGIAIPHAQSSTITHPAVLVIRYNNGIEWNSMDGSLIKIAIAIILPKDKVADMQIDILKNISVKLLDEEFVKTIKETDSKSWIIRNLLFSKKSETVKIDNNQNIENRKLLVAVTGCTTGIAKTYLCKENIEREAAKLGWNVHVETQGQKGKENALTAEQIEKADGILLALDIGIDMEPFVGKIFHKTDTDAVIKNPQAVLQDTMNYCAMIRKQRASGVQLVKSSKRKKITSEGQEDFIQSAGKGKPMVLKHILSGCSYLIPFVVFAGLTFSIITGISKLYFGPNFNFPATVKGIQDAIRTGTLAGNGWGTPTRHLNSINAAHVLYIINSIAVLGFQFMIPIMAAFIGFSIAGRAAMVSSFVTAFLLTQPGLNLWFDYNGKFIVDPNSLTHQIGGHDIPLPTAAGYSWTLFGGLYGGFVGGYITKALLKIKVPIWFAPAMPMVVIPFASTIFTAIPVAFLLAAPFGWIMGKIDAGMISLATKATTPNGGISYKLLGFLVGSIIGFMIGFDLGGPINKIAVLVATSLIGQFGVNGSDGGLLMGAAGAAIPVAPLGAGLVSVIFGRKMFNKGEKSNGVNALILGFMGISESGIPFLVRDTWRTMTANLVGSAVAGGIAYLMGTADRVGAYGSFIVGCVGGVASFNGSMNNGLATLLYFLAIIIGSLVQAFIYYSLLLQKEGKLSVITNFFKRRKNQTIDNEISTLEKS